MTLSMYTLFEYYQIYLQHKRCIADEVAVMSFYIFNNKRLEKKIQSHANIHDISSVRVNGFFFQIYIVCSTSTLALFRAYIYLPLV